MNKYMQEASLGGEIRVSKAIYRMSSGTLFVEGWCLSKTDKFDLVLQKIPHVNFNRLKGKAITDGNLRGLYSAADWALVEPYFAEESAFLAARGLAPLHEDPSR